MKLVERHDVAVGSLRYWERAGTFATTVRGLMGGALPDTGEARLTDAGHMLIWRSPTETLLLCSVSPEPSGDNGALSTIAAACADANDGRLVDQTGGISAFVIAGAHAPQLLSRLGSTPVPAVGQSRIGRLADLTVCTFSVRADETWLLVERVYAAHLRGWVDASLAEPSFGSG
jgi:sarcosine oxidase gamma subunit